MIYFFFPPWHKKTGKGQGRAEIDTHTRAGGVWDDFSDINMHVNNELVMQQLGTARVCVPFSKFQSLNETLPWQYNSSIYLFLGTIHRTTVSHEFHT